MSSYFFVLDTEWERRRANVPPASTVGRLQLLKGIQDVLSTSCIAPLPSSGSKESTPHVVRYVRMYRCRYGQVGGGALEHCRTRLAEDKRQPYSTYGWMESPKSVRLPRSSLDDAVDTPITHPPSLIRYRRHLRPGIPTLRRGLVT